MLIAVKLIRKLPLLGVVLLIFGSGLLPSGGWSAHGQETADNGIEESSPKPENRTQPQAVTNRIDRSLMQYSPEELRELERVYRESKQLPTSLETAMVNVLLEDGVASIRTEFIAINQLPGLVHRMELGLKRCQLVAAPEFTILDTSTSPVPESEQRVVPTLDGYQWLMLSSSPTRHRLVLNSQSLVERSTGRHSITIDLPLVQSEIVVQLPAGTTDERVRSDDLIINRTTDGSSVKLEIRSRGGPFTLSWNQANNIRPTGVVEATCETIYEPFDLMNPSQSWSATTTINIRWAASAGSQKVYIRLPPGGQWSNLPYSEIDLFRLSSIPFDESTPTLDLHLAPYPERPTADSAVTNSPILGAGAGTGDYGQAEVLVIENQDPSSLRSVDDLVLGWRWMPESENSDGRSNAFVVRSPEIVGVDTLEGTLGVNFPSSYDLDYHLHAGTSLIERGPMLDSGTSREQVLFGFNDHPAVVHMSFRKERILPTLRPTYRVHVAEGRMELTAWLHCWADGNPTEIGWYPAGWTLDEGSAVLLKDANLPQTANTEPLQLQGKEDGSYVISSRPLEPTASTQRVEQIWRLVAFRSWDTEESSRIEFELPRFDREVAFGNSRIESGSGLLIVSGEEHVVLQYDESSSQGIWPDFTPSNSSLYLRSNARTPLYFRFIDRGSEALSGISWAGNAVLLPLQIRQDQQVELSIQDSGIRISQLVDLQISNRPLNRLNLLVREDSLPIQVTMGETVLPYDKLNKIETTSGESPPAWSELQVNLLSSLQGRARIEIQSFLDWQVSQNPSDPAFGSESSRDAVSSEASFSRQASLIDVPLAVIQSPEIQVQARGRWQVQPNAAYEISYSSPTSHSAEYQLVRNSELELTAEQKSIRLSIQRRSSGQQLPIISSGIWLQTVLAGNDRRDRFVARVRSSTQTVTIQLPEQAVVEKVALGGIALSQELAPYDYNSNQVQVLLPDQNEHVIEVIYSLSQPLTWAQKLEIHSAFLVGVQQTDRFYWQLISPGVYHLGWCPEELTSEWRWKWSTAWWNRVSDLEQSSLERWIGAATLTRIPLGTNSYVMSARDQPGSMDVWIFSRFALWLPTGLAAIGFALLVSNIRALRSANSIVIGIAVFITLAMLWPEFSVLLSQTMLAAMALVAMIWLTQAAIGSRIKRRSIFSSRSQTLHDPSGSGPSLSTRSRQASNSNSAARAAVAETTGTE